MKNALSRGDTPESPKRLFRAAAPARGLRAGGGLAPLGLVLLCLLAAPAHAGPALSGLPQDEAGNREAPEGPVAPPPDTRAVEILERAARLQGGTEFAADLRTFHAHFDLEVFRADQGRGNFEVERAFVLNGSKGRLWTLKRLSGSDAPFSVMVYDGEDCWRVGEDGLVTVFTDQPSVYATDIRNMEDDARLTAQLFRFFFVQTWIREVSGLRYLGERTEGGIALHAIEGRMPAWIAGEGRTLVHLLILVRKEGDLIDRVRITDLARDGKRRTFRFDRYYRNPQGVLVPCNVKIYGDDESHHEMQIALKADFRHGKDASGKDRRIVVPHMEFNVKIPAEYFRLPEEDRLPAPKGPWTPLPAAGSGDRPPAAGDPPLRTPGA